MTETETEQQTAVRYERDDEGIVSLILDDPTASANTMNELYQRSMHAAVDRLYDEVGQDPQSVTGVLVTSAKKTFFAGGNLTLMMQAGPDDAATVFAARWSRRSTVPRSVAASRSPSPASTGSSSTTPPRWSVCPRRPSGSCPAVAGSPGSCGCWACSPA
jgi:3-hydroxyacyl-CoA dehydrogenase/enoyl-CoA hydratase/3-hydroxybutyryl-CoA epimerase